MLKNKAPRANGTGLICVCARPFSLFGFFASEIDKMHVKETLK